MKTLTRTRKATRMNADAYAGFLKLWLTPANRTAAPSPEVDAYLEYANERDPLPEELCLPAPRKRPRAA
jgi:hypothetical protein